MTALEAIPKISQLLVRLIQLSKDAKTGTLIQQIQQHQLVVHAELMEKDARIRQLQQQLVELQPEDIQIHRTIEFRRGKRTGMKWLPFCPGCKMPAATPQFGIFVECTAGCGWESTVRHSDLPKVMTELPP